MYKNRYRKSGQRDHELVQERGFQKFGGVEMQWGTCSGDMLRLNLFKKRGRYIPGIRYMWGALSYVKSIIRERYVKSRDNERSCWI